MSTIAQQRYDTASETVANSVKAHRSSAALQAEYQIALTEMFAARDAVADVALTR